MVGCGLGLATVDVSDDRIGRFAPGHRVDVRDGTWIDAGSPADDVVDVAYGPAVDAVTGDGTFFVDAPVARDGSAGWRSRTLGLGDVTGLAVPWRWPWRGVSRRR